MESINERIKKLRLDRNLTQEEFGAQIGLSKSGISNIEKGIRSVTTRHIKLISKVFGIPEFWIQFGDGEQFIDSEQKIREYNAMKEYLISLGYQVQDEPIPETATWHYEDNTDENGNVLSRSKMIDDCEIITSLMKMGERTSFTAAEFDRFQAEISAFVEYQIWKSHNKK